MQIDIVSLLDFFSKENERKEIGDV